MNKCIGQTLVKTLSNIETETILKNWNLYFTKKTCFCLISDVEKITNIIREIRNAKEID